MSITLQDTLALHPSVAVRPEPFGALLYHFGTRGLSFLKERTLLDIVQRLDGSASVSEVFAAVGIEPARHARYLKALETLIASKMLVLTTTKAEAA